MSDSRPSRRQAIAPSRIALCGRDGPAAMWIDSIGAVILSVSSPCACPVGHEQRQVAVGAAHLHAELAQHAAVRNARASRPARGRPRCRCSRSAALRACRDPTAGAAHARRCSSRGPALGSACGAANSGRKLSLLAVLAKAAHAEDVEHLVVERGGALRDDVVGGRAVVEVEAVGAALEEVDRRHAVQLEVVGLDRALERRDVAIEEQHDLERVAGWSWRTPRPGRRCR